MQWRKLMIEINSFTILKIFRILIFTFQVLFVCSGWRGSLVRIGEFLETFPAFREERSRASKQRMKMHFSKPRWRQVRGRMRQGLWICKWRSPQNATNSIWPPESHRRQVRRRTQTFCLLRPPSPSWRSSWKIVGTRGKHGRWHLVSESNVFYDVHEIHHWLKCLMKISLGIFHLCLEHPPMTVFLYMVVHSSCDDLALDFNPRGQLVPLLASVSSDE